MLSSRWQRSQTIDHYHGSHYICVEQSCWLGQTNCCEKSSCTAVRMLSTQFSNLHHPPECHSFDNSPHKVWPSPGCFILAHWPVEGWRWWGYLGCRVLGPAIMFGVRIVLEGWLTLSTFGSLVRKTSLTSLFTWYNVWHDTILDCSSNTSLWIETRIIIPLRFAPEL